MILSGKWFPTNLPARAVWYANFSKQFGIVAASIGLASDVAQVEADNAVIQFIADTFNQIKAFDDAMRQYRRIITEGNIGETTPAIPASPVYALPAAVPTGIFERLNDLRDRITVATDYTDEIGALLGILTTKSIPIAPTEAKPTIQAFAAQTGYMYSMIVANRAESDVWEVWELRKGATGWKKAESFTGKSGDVTVQPTTPGDAEQMQVRVQLRKNNANYGQPSDVVYVTVNP